MIICADNLLNKWINSLAHWLVGWVIVVVVVVLGLFTTHVKENLNLGVNYCLVIWGGGAKWRVHVFDIVVFFPHLMN